jgi:hypothetical protein
MVWVLQHSEERMGSRLVLIALAEFAHDDGSHAWPSIQTLADRTRLSERQVRNCLRQLESSGAIVETGRSRRGTHIYTVLMDQQGAANISGGQSEHAGGQSTTGNVQQIAPDPSGPVMDPPGGNELKNGQDLVAHFVDISRDMGVDPPSKVVGHVASQVGLLLGEGQPYDRVERALDLLVERRMNPSALASLILEAGAGPARRRRLEEERQGSNLSGTVEAPTPLPPRPSAEEMEEAKRALTEISETILKDVPSGTSG